MNIAIIPASHRVVKVSAIESEAEKFWNKVWRTLYAFELFNFAVTLNFRDEMPIFPHWLQPVYKTCRLAEGSFIHMRGLEGRWLCFYFWILLRCPLEALKSQAQLDEEFERAEKVRANAEKLKRDRGDL